MNYMTNAYELYDKLFIYVFLVDIEGKSFTFFHKKIANTSAGGVEMYALRHQHRFIPKNQLIVCHQVIFRAYSHLLIEIEVIGDLRRNRGVRCSSVVRAFAHGAMSRQSDPSWWTH